MPAPIAWRYTSEARLSPPGGESPRRVPLAAVRASWELSNVGAFSGFVRQRDLRAAGCGGALGGWWLDWEHPTLGMWRGVISGRPVRDGVVELSAEGLGSLLRGRILFDWDDPPAGAAAGIARRAFMAAESADPLWITLGSVEEAGPPLTTTLGGQDFLDDTLPQLSDDGGLEWLVDRDHRLHLGHHLGTDQSAAVRWSEGRELLDVQLPDAEYLASRVEQFHLATVEVQPRVPAARPAGGVSRSSRARWVRPGVVAGASGGQYEAGGLTITETTVTRMRTDTVPMTCDLADTGHAWRRVALGDRVRVVVGSAQLSGVFRIITVGYDESGNTLSLGGEVLADG